jgi:hypothetical protein
VRAESWFRFLFVLYCLEAGLFLVLAPWTEAWERVVLLLPLGFLRQLLGLSWIRGLVSGFGLVHLVWAAHDVDLILRPPPDRADPAALGRH